MVLSKMGLAAGCLAAVLAAGCSSTRVGPMDSQPAPLPPAPAGTVVGGTLPPPTGPAPGDPAGFPSAPVDVAAAPPAANPAAPDLTAGGVAGVWTVSMAGQSCKVATPQTRFGSGFRAGPLRCPAPMDGVKSWNVAGKQLSFYDASGTVVAQLYQAGAEQFNGQTSTGLPVSLGR